MNFNNFGRLGSLGIDLAFRLLTRSRRSYPWHRPCRQSASVSARFKYLLLTLAISQCLSGQNWPATFLSYTASPKDWNHSNPADMYFLRARVTLTAPATYFSITGWNAGVAGGGYLGIQDATSGGGTRCAEANSGRNYIFTVWDPTSGGEQSFVVYSTPSGNACHGTGEGGGAGYLNYGMPWQIGNWYQFVLKAWTYHSNTYFAFWSLDESADTWTHHATLAYPAPNILLSGGIGSFIEYFGPQDGANANEKRRAEYNAIWLRSSSHNWAALRHALFQVGSGNGQDAYDAGVRDGAFYMQGGGDTTPSLHPGTILSLPVVGTGPMQSVGQTTIASASYDVTTNQLNVSWVADPRLSPQFSYKVDVFDNPDWEGIPEFTQSDIAPHIRAIVVPAAMPPDKVHYIRVITADIFDQQAQPIGITHSNRAGALVISSLSPGTAVSGSVDLTVTVTGNGFAEGSQVQWNGVALSTTLVSPTQLTAIAPAGMLASAGTGSVVVTNPDSAVSDALLFIILAPPPQVSSVSPSSVPVNGGPFTLLVDGGYFSPTGVVHWNSTALDTTYVSPSQLTARVPADLLESAGSASVSVTNRTGQISNRVQLPVTSGLITTLAGSELPATQAPAVDTSIPLSTGIASDSVGNVYFASQQLHSVFRLSTEGILTRVAGKGEPGFSGDGGSALSAQLNQPQGVALDAAGNLFIADVANQRIRKVNPEGIIATVAGNGSCCYSGDNGPATIAQLGSPQGVAVDGDNNLFIADSGGARVRKVGPSGIITTFAGSGTAGYSGDGGPAVKAQLSYPIAAAVNSSGELYIADSYNHAIRKISSDGTISTVAGTGERGYSGDGGPANRAQLNSPNGIALDHAGRLLIADTGSRLVRVVGTNGTITTVAGNGGNGNTGDGGPAASAEISSPSGVAVDNGGRILIVDKTNQRIRTVSGGIIGTIAGAAFREGVPAVFAGLNQPGAVAKDAQGNVYIADSGNHSVRKVATDGSITTLAGTGVSGYSGDGGRATNARLNQPAGVAVDSSSAVFIADSLNHRIRKVAADGTITTFAGTGCCYGGDNRPAAEAQLNYPRGLFIDPSGSLFIADTGNNRIRKVDPNGIITTVAGDGHGGAGGDGGLATSAELRAPQAIAADSRGNLYIADTDNSLIRMVDGNGTISLFAGSISGNSGDGGAATRAELGSPAGVAVDAMGNVYIADTRNGRIRMVNTSGAINTVAGNGDWGWDYSGDGGVPLNASIRNPAGLFSDTAGMLYVADQAYNNIRVLIPSGRQPVLDVQSVHTGDFAAGQLGNYTVTVSNALGAAPTIGPVTFTAAVRAGMTIQSLSGSDWNCSASQCTRSDALADGTSYPPITVTVAIEGAVGTQATPQFSVSGGGGIAAGRGDFTRIEFDTTHP
ncbi:DUF3472 domain-containing protein [Paludibaculum fermentans]|uniref:NHL domain-containing protein n=1 Tax=Paludibaculum fermentans TaxID=1473598 RepID=UPI003EBE08D3